MKATRERRTSRARVAVLRAIRLLVGSCALLGGLFIWNGLENSWRHPESGANSLKTTDASQSMTIMAWNLAKCDFHLGGWKFKTPDEVRALLDNMAQVIREQGVDLLFISEVVFEAYPCPVNQVEYLAKQAGFANWSYGDNYSFGIPGVKIRSGNAILSRFPLEGFRVDELAGNSSIWNPTGNRRLLWAELELNGGSIVCGSVRNDSFDLENNARQVRSILESLPDGPVLLAGDFNAEPGDEPMDLWRASSRFQGVYDGPATYPAHAPNRRIDTILVPKEWIVVGSARVLDVDLSDHEPVIVTVTLP